MDWKIILAVVVVVFLVIGLIIYFLVKKKTNPSPSPEPSSGIKVKPDSLNAITYEVCDLTILNWKDLLDPKVAFDDSKYQYTNSILNSLNGTLLLQFASKGEIDDVITISADSLDSLTVPVTIRKGNPTKISSTETESELTLDFDDKISFEITNYAQLVGVSYEIQDGKIAGIAESVGTLGHKYTITGLSTGSTIVKFGASSVPDLTYTIVVKEPAGPKTDIILSATEVNCAPEQQDSFKVTNFKDLSGLTATSEDSVITVSVGANGTINLACLEDGSATVTVNASNANSSKTVSVTVGLDIDDVDKYDVANGDTSDPKRIIGYFTNWAQYRVDLEYGTDNIPIDQLTHIVYAFFPINDNYEVKYSDAWADIGKSTIANVISLRGKGKVEAIMFSVGGWTYCGDTFGKTFEASAEDAGTVNTKTYKDIWNDILTNSAARTAFVASVQTIMNAHDFDGVDIDLEHPVCPQNACDTAYEDQKDGYVSLMTALRQKLGTSKLISIAGAASYKVLKTGYDLEKLAAQIDWFNVMTYDYHVATEAKTGHNQPKRDSKDGFDVNYTLYKYLDAGIPGSKLNVGLAMYTRGFVVSATDYSKAIANKTFSGIVVKSPSAATKWLQQEGTAAAFELYSTYPKANSYYVEKEGSWLCDTDTHTLESYTDVQDMAAINDIRIKKQIGGIMYYAIDQDDYPGTITGTKNLFSENFNAINAGTITTNFVGANNITIYPSYTSVYLAPPGSTSGFKTSITAPAQNASQFPSPLTYISKNDAIAKVTGLGLITAVALGKTEMIISDASGATTITVHVPIFIVPTSVTVYGHETIPWGKSNVTIQSPQGVFPLRIMDATVPPYKLTANSTAYVYDSDKDVYWMNRVAGDETQLEIKWDAVVYNSTLAFDDTLTINLTDPPSDLAVNQTGATTFTTAFDSSVNTIVLTSLVEDPPDTLESLLITSSQFSSNITIKVMPYKWRACVFTSTESDFKPIEFSLAQNASAWVIPPKTTDITIRPGKAAMIFEDPSNIADFYSSDLVSFKNINIEQGKPAIAVTAGDSTGETILYYRIGSVNHLTNLYIKDDATEIVLDKSEVTVPISSTPTDVLIQNMTDITGDISLTTYSLVYAVFSSPNVIHLTGLSEGTERVIVSTPGLAYQLITVKVTAAEVSSSQNKRRRLM